MTDDILALDRSYNNYCFSHKLEGVLLTSIKSELADEDSTFYD